MVTKAHILQEIKRTAEEAGGKPLGKQRFASETGINKSDWLGRYWVCWSDAIGEAGYTPNRLSSRTDSVTLLDKYAGLARELGHLPTDPELRLKRRNDCTFPNHDTFRRFGAKLELIRHLAQYCHDHAGYDDVVRLCEEYVSQTQQASADESESSTKENEESFGFVYLMKSGKGNLYKIGRSKSIARRASNLRGQLPEKLKIIDVIQTDAPNGMEAYWKKRFAAKRLRNEGILTECFELDSADVAAFKRLRVHHVKPSL